jgi:hypothetical protein
VHSKITAKSTATDKIFSDEPEDDESQQVGSFQPTIIASLNVSFGAIIGSLY